MFIISFQLVNLYFEIKIFCMNFKITEKKRGKLVTTEYGRPRYRCHTGEKCTTIGTVNIFNVLLFHFS